MNNRKAAIKRFKLARRFAILLAAAPLFQVSACQTFTGQFSANFVNSLPSTAFSVLLSYAVLPIRIIINGGSLFNPVTGAGG